MRKSNIVLLAMAIFTSDAHARDEVQAIQCELIDVYCQEDPADDWCASQPKRIRVILGPSSAVLYFGGDRSDEFYEPSLNVPLQVVLTEGSLDISGQLGDEESPFQHIVLINISRVSLRGKYDRIFRVDRLESGKGRSGDIQAHLTCNLESVKRKF